MGSGEAPNNATLVDAADTPKRIGPFVLGECALEVQGKPTLDEWKKAGNSYALLPDGRGS